MYVHTLCMYVCMNECVNSKSTWNSKLFYHPIEHAFCGKKKSLRQKDFAEKFPKAKSRWQIILRQKLMRQKFQLNNGNIIAVAISSSARLTLSCAFWDLLKFNGEVKNIAFFQMFIFLIFHYFEGKIPWHQSTAADFAVGCTWLIHLLLPLSTDSLSPIHSYIPWWSYTKISICNF